MFLPKIILLDDIQKEINIFYDFLHHPYFPQHRNMLFNAFSELKEKIENHKLNEEEERIIIGDFISSFRKKHKNSINKIINESKEKIKKNEKNILHGLANLMNYNWLEENKKYSILPTIFITSPFYKNYFCFSILKAINKQKQPSILFIATHEISHLILRDILCKSLNTQHEELDNFMGHKLLYFLQEILAPILMKQKVFSSLLDTKDYLGNPNLKYIFIQEKNKDNTPFQITDFFQQLYERMKYDEKKDFNLILEKMIDILKSIETDLSKRYDMWSKYGHKILTTEKLLDKYNLPIHYTEV